MRRTFLVLSLFALVLTSCGGPDNGPGHYEGTSVSFDYPSGWHEFDLSAGLQDFAAYGPVWGGNVDAVAVFPAPPETEGMAFEELVTWGSSSEAGLTANTRPTAPPHTVDVNGLSGYMMSMASTGAQYIEARMILVGGERGNYLITCQWLGGTDFDARNREEEVMAGCEMLMDTLVETPRGQ